MTDTVCTACIEYNIGAGGIPSNNNELTTSQLHIYSSCLTSHLSHSHPFPLQVHKCLPPSPSSLLLGPNIRLHPTQTLFHPGTVARPLLTVYPGRLNSLAICI